MSSVVTLARRALAAMSLGGLPFRFLAIRFNLPPAYGPEPSTIFEIVPTSSLR
jgi:hypothetical protein